MEGHTSHWTEYRPAEDLRQYDIPVEGDLVTAHYLLATPNGFTPIGAMGKVVCSGRGLEADQQFKEREALAVAQNRKLTSEDYECLIDAEGPVVDWPNGDRCWYPGQSMGAIDLVKALPTW
jgi:hypothetical protein